MPDQRRDHPLDLMQHLPGIRGGHQGQADGMDLWIEGMLGADVAGGSVQLLHMLLPGRRERLLPHSYFRNMATKLPKKKSATHRTSKQPTQPPVPPGNPMRDLHKLMEKQQFGSMEEIEAFMQKYTKEPIPEFEPETEEEQAEELAYDALQLDGEEARDLLMEALTLDPDCILAYYALGAAETHPAIALAFFERGVILGMTRFHTEEYLKENKGHFWGIHETRPFMQCLQGAADCQFALGRVFEAIAVWNLMLELNTNDNQGVRYDLMLCLAGFGDTESFEELEKEYKDDVSAAAAFNRVLYLFKSQGPGPQTLQALQAARTRNKHVVPLLLKQDPELYAVEGYTLGSKEEAMSYLDKAHLVWSGVPGAKEWLKRVAGT